MVDFVRPELSDVDALIANMRGQDVDEVHATGRTDLRAVVEEGLARSVFSVAARVGGETACIFGVAPFATALDPRGVPWMLGTHLVPRNARTLMRLTPRYIRAMLEVFPHLINHVHARNTLAIAWLRHMGFAVHDKTHPVGPAAEPFHLFEMKRHV